MLAGAIRPGESAGPAAQSDTGKEPEAHRGTTEEGAAAGKAFSARQEDDSLCVLEYYLDPQLVVDAKDDTRVAWLRCWSGPGTKETAV